MAVQEEINEALKQEVEDDEEEVDGEVVYHHTVVDDHDENDDCDEGMHSELNITDNITSIQQSTPEKNKSDPWQDETDIYSPALTMNTTEKPPRNVISTEDSQDSPSKFEESFSWEGVESKPAKPVKLLSNNTTHIYTQENNSNTTAAEAQVAVAGVKTEQLPAPATEKTLRSTTSTVPSKPPAAPKPLPSNNILPTGSRKVKPLKPKQKVQKQLDFFGVGTSTTEVKTIEKTKQKGKPIDQQVAIDSVSASQETNAGVGSSDLFFGLFGDDSYISENNTDDVETGASKTTTTSSTSNENTSSIQPVHSQRLPLGWLSSMVGAADPSTVGEAAGSAFSFFDDPEDGSLGEEDPILKQVEYNRLHPHAAAELRAGSGVSGSVGKVLDLWSAFMAEDSSSSASSSGGHSNTQAVGASDSSTLVATTIPNDQIEAIIPGLGPSWVVACLTYLRYITGISLSIVDASNTALYRGSSGGSGSSSTVGSLRYRIEQNLKHVTFKIFTTQLQLPAEYSAGTICILLLYIIRLVCMILISVVLRIIVILCTLFGVCVRCTVRYVSGTEVGRASSARLRRFFMNENVNTVLGNDSSSSGSGDSSDQVYILLISHVVLCLLF